MIQVRGEDGTEKDPVEENCSWCGKVIEGFKIEGPHGGTGGYYEMGNKGYWYDVFRRADTDRAVCDACMWADPRYKAHYGEYT